MPVTGSPVRDRIAQFTKVQKNLGCYHPPSMDVLALFVTMIGLAAWLGSAVFMTFFVAPLVNRKLGPSQAREVMDVIAPRQYWLAFASALLMVFGGTGALFYPNLRTPTITFLALTGAALAVVLYASLVIAPRTISLRDRLQSSAGSEMNIEVRERYDQAIRMGTFLNVLSLLFLICAAAALAFLIAGVPRFQAGQ